jgi:hypothetical protein
VRKEFAPAPEFDRQDLLNVRGAAKLSGLSKNFIYQRIGKPGGPPFVMRRNRIRLPREDFLIWSKQPIPPDRHSGYGSTLASSCGILRRSGACFGHIPHRISARNRMRQHGYWPLEQTAHQHLDPNRKHVTISALLTVT